MQNILIRDGVSFIIVICKDNHAVKKVGYMDDNSGKSGKMGRGVF